MALSLISYPKVVFKSSSAPEGVQGRLWVDTDDGKIYYYDGSSWISMTPSGSSNIQELFTGSDFDSAATTTTENIGSYELNSIAANSEITYVLITIKGRYLNNSVNAAQRITEIQNKVQIKDIGGSYADVGSGYEDVCKISMTEPGYNDEIKSHMILHQLTAGEKSNGFQLKVFSRCYCYSAADSNCSFENIETKIEIF